MGTDVPVLGVMWLRCTTDHPPLLALRLKKSRAVPLCPLWAFKTCSMVNFTFTSTSYTARKLPALNFIRCTF